jgi:demethylmenaquinone methyltransferase/2-methoxy-6-polyprenyl-1,4-benzoquinol methylase
MQTLPPEKAETSRMQAMFHIIAPRYDFITRAFSFGMDARWKRHAVAGAQLRKGARVLDLACGTGDFARLTRQSGAWPVGADLTLRMLTQSPDLSDSVCADACRLPFPDHSFDAVFTGYGVRNFPKLAEALAEARRVLKPGGKLVVLDFYLPENLTYRRLYLGYLHVQGALWGALLHGQPDVYTYIPRSLDGFLTADEFSSLLHRQGFENISMRTFLLGGIALHWACRDGHR